MTSNSRAKAEANIALPPHHPLEDGGPFAPEAREAPLRGRQHFSEHPGTNPVTSLSRVEPAHLEPESIPNPRSRTMRSAYESAKRAFDLLLGSVLLIVAIPIIFIAAIAI